MSIVIIDKTDGHLPDKAPFMLDCTVCLQLAYFDTREEAEIALENHQHAISESQEK